MHESYSARIRGKLARNRGAEASIIGSEGLISSSGENMFLGKMEKNALFGKITISFIE